jgi:VanZ family protein
MAIIFLASTDALSAQHTGSWIIPILWRLFPHMAFQSIDLTHFFIRKCAHLIEYAILGSLLWRAVPEYKAHPEVADWCRAGIAILVATFYASTDEYHQSFVPSRGPSIHDVVIDACVATVAVIIVCLASRQRNHREIIPARTIS